MITFEEEQEMYGVVRHSTTPFNEDSSWNMEEVYGVLVGETSIRAFECQRPGVYYSIEKLEEDAYFVKYGHLDLGSKSDYTICDDIIIFQHEDIEIQDHMEYMLDAYKGSINMAMKITTRFLEFDKQTHSEVIQGLYDAQLSVIKTNVSLTNFKPLPLVEDYLTRNLQYDNTWRGRF